MAHRPHCARSVRHDVAPSILPSGPPSQSSILKKFLIAILSPGLHPFLSWFLPALKIFFWQVPYPPTPLPPPPPPFHTVNTVSCFQQLVTKRSLHSAECAVFLRQCAHPSRSWSLYCPCHCILSCTVQMLPQKKIKESPLFREGNARKCLFSCADASLIIKC